MKILTFSDIHFRNSSMFKAHEALVVNVCKLAKEISPDRIVVVGDVFEQKTTLSPEAICNVMSFFERLLDIAPIDLISGNHDLNMSNMNRYSSLQPIVDAFNLRKDGNPINFYDTSGLYPIANSDIVYGVFEIRDTSDKWPVDFKKEKDKTYIALYHGTINGSRTDIGQVLDSPNNISLFKNYDITMLGDIHLRQFLDTKKTIAYPGSILLQNFGEEGEKGFLVWDTESREATFVPVPNDYNFITINVATIGDVDAALQKEHVTKHSKIRVQCEAYLTNTEIEEAKIEISNKYHLDEFPIVNCGVNQLEQTQIELQENWTNYSDPSEQRKLIIQWLESKHKGEETISEVLSIHEECKKKLNLGDYKNNSWELLKIKIDNIGVYGEGNVLETNKLHGIVGIFAKNKYGKTTLIDSISLALYGEFIKEEAVLDDCLNYLKKNGGVEIEIKLSGVIWKVTRTLKRSKAGSTSQKVRLEKFNGDQWINETKDDVKSTNKALIDLFGTKEDLLNTAIASSEDIYGLVKGKESARLAAFNRFSGISFFESLYDIAKNDIYDVKSQLKAVQNLNSSDAYKQKEGLAKQCEEAIGKLESEFPTIEKEIEKLENSILEIKNTLIEIPENVSDIRTLKSEIYDVESSLNKKNQQLQQSQNQIQSLTNKWKNLRDDIKLRLSGKKVADVTSLLPTIEGIEQEKITIISEQNEISTQVKHIQKDVQQATREVQQLQRQIEILSRQDWHEINNDCKRCDFLSDAWKAKESIPVATTKLTLLEDKLPILLDSSKELEERLEIVEKTLREVGFTSREIRGLENDKNELDTLKSKVDIEKEKLILTEAQIPEIEKQLLELKQRLSSFENIEKDIETNKKIENEISILMRRKENTITHKKEVEKQIYGKKSELARYEGEMENILENLQIISRLERAISNYQLYMECVDWKGLPLAVIHSLLPKINAEVNAILSNAQNWRINININDNSKLLINFIDAIDGQEVERKIEVCSGAERAIGAIALRCALNRISSVPKANFMVFDESFSSIDPENITLMKNFLVAMKQNFSFIILISHQHQMRDIVDETIQIERIDNGFSSITN